MASPKIHSLTLTVVALAILLSGSRASGQASVSGALGQASGKVLVIGLPGVTWQDLSRTKLPTLHKLMNSGAVGNASVRVSNQAAEGYATLGSGQRVQVNPSAGWAFNRDETVEHGPASALYHRLSNRQATAQIVISTIALIRERNVGASFGASPGLLASRLQQSGRQTAVIGNADPSLDPLPDSLPNPTKLLTGPNPIDAGIHREAALAAMDAEGQVPNGNVSRDLLEPNPDAPFGVTTSPAKLQAAFADAWKKSDLIVVEPGETARADTYSLNLPESKRPQIRAQGLRRTDRLVSQILDQVDASSTLVALVAPTTPGGPTERGELRPVVLSGPGMSHGLLTSQSTNRRGLVWMPDITATIARHLGLGGSRFAGGRVVEVQQASNPVKFLSDMNRRAVVHDVLRAPVTLFLVAFELFIYVAALRKLRTGPLSRTMQFGLLAALSLPVASFVSVAWFWKSGPGFALLAISAAMLGLAGAAVLMGSRKRLSGPMLILALTFAFFIADLAVGAPSQIDSIFGYTSVAAGRFFGLGNSGFGLLAAAAFLLAGILADSRIPRGRWIAFGVITVAIVADGHPLLGDDVGGTLSLAPAAVAFALGLSARDKFSKKYLLIGVLAAVGAVAVFGAIDLARPVAARTHLGDFLSNAFIHPASVWLVFKRKAGLAVSIALSNYLGLAVPGAVAVLVLLHRRTGHRLRTLLKGHQGLSAGLDALIVAAVLGSILNDSGVAVAGMMLAIAAPWSIIVASELASPSPAG